MEHSEAQGRAYANKTLVGNWYEDRWAEREERSNAQTGGRTSAKASGSTAETRQTSQRPLLPDTWRTQAVDYPADPATPHIPAVDVDRLTTKQEAESHLQEKLRPVQRKRMVNHANLRQALGSERRTAKPATGFGAALPRHSHPSTNEDWVTTSQLFYEQKVAAARAADPSMASNGQQGTSCSGKLYRDTYTFGKAEDQFSGRSGCRGTLTRHPGEAGSVYGVSTFVDDYAQWGTKLHGVTLGQTRAGKLTRHFDA